MPIVLNSAANPVEMLPGVVRRTLTDGDKMMLCEIRMEAGAVVPLHTHPHEQTGYLVSGRCRFKLGDEVRELSAGDTWMVPGGAEHEATALEECDSWMCSRRPETSTANERRGKRPPSQNLDGSVPPSVIPSEPCGAGVGGQRCDYVPISIASAISICFGIPSSR